MEWPGIKSLRLSSVEPWPSPLQSEEEDGFQESGRFMFPTELVEHMRTMDAMDKQQSEKKSSEDVTMEEPGSSSGIGSALLDEQLTDDEKIRVCFLKAILDGKNEKARRDMKERMRGVIGQSSLEDCLRKECLDALCVKYLNLLTEHFTEAATSTSMDMKAVSQIARHAGNLSWLVDIMVRGEMVSDFVKRWTSQTALSDAYYKVKAAGRYRVMGITAVLLMGIGKGFHINLDARFSLLKKWLGPLCDDFEWLEKFDGVNMRLIEHGLGGAIFSMPAKMQHELLLLWFDKLQNSDQECPQLKGWFEAWWLSSF